MAVLVSLAGLAVAVIGLLGVVAPGRLKALLASWPVLTALPATVALRIGFGALFLAAAPSCRLPGLVRLVGLLELAGAAVLLALGSKRLERFVAWWLELPSPYVRTWCAAALGLGVLLVYAGAG